MKNIVIILLIPFLLYSKGFSQDLILNGDFEDINICTEAIAPCSPEAWRLTTTLIPGNESPGDNNYTSFVVFNSSSKNVRSYLQSRLADGLIIGQKYKLTLDISAGDLMINSIGILFSDTIILSKSSKYLEIEPTLIFENNNKLLKPKRTKDWLHFEKEFVAENNSQFILIGCFLPDTDLIYKFRRGSYKPYKDYHYFIDNISLLPLGHSHDTSKINKTKREIYAQNHRHPVPDELFDLKLSKDTIGIINQTSVIDTIILCDDLLFEFDSYQPSDYLIQKIDSVVENITLSIDSILIYGHTDNIGTDDYNKELSLKRAKSVSGYITSLYIITDDRILIQGKGSEYPIASNATDIGRYKNRRVEIIIKYRISR